MMTVLDLFSGIGGFAIGLERTCGFRTTGFVEIDNYAGRVLKKNWPDIPLHHDVTQYEFREGEADVITAGFPCQDISLAGEGAGLSGSRSGLYREVVRAIRVVRPQFAILENVAALLCRGMGTVLGDLAEIGADAEWHCIPASAVGAPHRRDRVWIVADTRGEQYEGCRAPLSGTLAAELSRFAPDAAPMLGASLVGNEQDGNSTRSSSMADTDSQGLPIPREEPHGENGEHCWRMSSAGGWWSAEPDVDRMAHGISSRVDRLRTLGNAVVPQVVTVIGRAILASERVAA